MAPDDGDSSALRRQVGDDLRAVIDTLLTRSAGPDDLRRAHQLLEETRAALGGPPAPAYNADPGYWAGTPGGWDRYMDSTMFGGGTNPLGMPMPLEYGTDAEGRLYAEGTVELGRAYLGGPGMVHGGYVAGMIDHMFGAAMHAGPLQAVTATLTVRFTAPTPVHRPLRFRAWFEHSEGRRLVGRATCHHGDVRTAEAEGLFVRVDLGDLAERMSGATPA
jgi:acyl-coenzyme A thioesterase PaaI-like protein